MKSNALKKFDVSCPICESKITFRNRTLSIEGYCANFSVIRGHYYMLTIIGRHHNILPSIPPIIERQSLQIYSTRGPYNISHIFVNNSIETHLSFDKYYQIFNYFILPFKNPLNKIINDFNKIMLIS